MTTHVLKVDPAYFDAVNSGAKTFEVRKNDRGYQLGDILVLWEYAPEQHGAGVKCGGPDCYTEHRTIRRVVSYVYSGDPRWPALQPGYVVLGLSERIALNTGAPDVGPARGSQEEGTT